MPKKFKYKGIPKPNYVKTMGKFMQFKVQKKDGTWHEFNSSNPNGFQPNEDFDIPDDEVAIKNMRAHPHFSEHPGGP